MGSIAWSLSENGLEVGVYEVDPSTRKLHLIAPLRRVSPMTEEEALKYVNANYPKDSNSVRVAAEILGLKGRP